MWVAFPFNPREAEYMQDFMHRSHKWLSLICWPATHLLAKMHLPFYSDSNRLRASLVAQLVKNLLAMQETWVQSLGWDPLEKGKATHSSILAWRICTIQSMGSQRVGHDWATFTSLHNRLKFLLPSVKICILTTSTFGSWLSSQEPAQYISGPPVPFSLLRSNYISLGVGPMGPCPQQIPPPTHTFTMKAKILRKINSELYFKLAGGKQKGKVCPQKQS